MADKFSKDHPPADDDFTPEAVKYRETAEHTKEAEEKSAESQDGVQHQGPSAHPLPNEIVKPAESEDGSHLDPAPTTHFGAPVSEDDTDKYRDPSGQE